ncbi:tyrosine-type recombinase/integrase [Hydrogenovibrio halophilus]|uniref:tyrosine-type recombinase/integrase n=1 Tax=Hydrogenovibrio halophilus TaxID=373391 RepID=UPI00036E859D|nr:tyrosine-type recombinase/integrase [Hydrogenovibrio halophilus]
MRLIRATNDFKLHGHSYEDFPLIVNSEMELETEVHQFLIYFCITRGRVESKNTWWRYGQDLYDYFGYLEGNGLDWRSKMADTQHSVIAAYRDWSVSLGLSSKTINGRLRTIIQFYEFAQRKHWIESVPYDIETVIINKGKGFLAHTDRSGNQKNAVNVMLKEKVAALQVLTKQEVKILMAHPCFISQHLIYRLALQTGMRKEELLTFPESYIQDPRTKRGKAIVPVVLSTKDMEVKSGQGGTKGNKERTIHIPISLYERLWQYKLHERNELLLKNEVSEQKTLLLNRFAKPYSIKGTILNTELKKIVGRKEISLHKLRHTYATFKLYGLRHNPNYRGDPLVYVQDRLGHSSILTTQVYLHYLEDLEGDLMTEYDQDIDQICLGSEGVA